MAGGTVPRPEQVYAGRLRRITHGTLANILAQVLNVLGQVALVPVFLQLWGNQLYGEWLTLSAAGTYLSMLDFGMNSYLVNRLTQSNARGVRHQYTEILHSGLLLSLVMSTVAVMLGILVVAFSPLERWFRLAAMNHSTAVLVTIFLGAQVAYAIPCGVLAGVYRSVNEYPRGQMVVNTRVCVGLLLTALIVASGQGPVVVATAQLMTLVVTSVYIWWDLRRRHPELQLGLGQASFRLAISFIPPSSAFLISQLAMALTAQGSIVLIGTLFGPSMVVVFVTLRTLTNLSRQGIAALQHAVWPEFTTLDAQERRESLRNLHLLTAKLVILFAVCAAVFLHFMGESIVIIWTGKRVAYQAQLMTAFLLLGFSQAQWSTSSIFLVACNQLKGVVACVISSSAAGLGLGYMLAQRFGMPGFIYGLLIPDLLVCGWFIPWVACQMMGEKSRRYLIEILLRGVAVSGIVFSAVELLVGFLPVTAGTLRQLVPMSALIGTIGLAAAYVVGLNQFEKSRIRLLLSGLLAR